MNAIFTIVAKNYTGLAQVLESSVRKNSNDDFFIFIADDVSYTQDIKIPLPDNVLIARNVLQIDNVQWEQMAFKYNLVEFCTAIKASCFEYLFNKGYDKIIYLDPDVYVYGPLDYVFNQLQNFSIVVTPHILMPQSPFKGSYSDDLFLLNGTFNLGFLALGKSSVTNHFLQWWNDRLMRLCFFDNDLGTATDQKWMNLLPALFQQKDFLVSRHKGMNVAPWNFHEREIVQENDKFYVKERGVQVSDIDALVFVHFSGYDYTRIRDGNTAHKTNHLEGYHDLAPLFKIYADQLAQSAFLDFRNQPYSYNQFDNGVGILSLHRRIFRRLIEEQQIFDNPFSTGVNSFYNRLKSKGLLDMSPLSADKITNKNIKNFSTKLRYVHMFFYFVRVLIGVRRYTMLIRFLRRFFREENQVFLLDKEVSQKLL